MALITGCVAGLVCEFVTDCCASDRGAIMTINPAIATAIDFVNNWIFPWQKRIKNHNGIGLGYLSVQVTVK